MMDSHPWSEAPAFLVHLYNVYHVPGEPPAAQFARDSRGGFLLYDREGVKLDRVSPEQVSAAERYLAAHDGKPWTRPQAARDRSGG